MTVRHFYAKPSRIVDLWPRGNARSFPGQTERAIQTARSTERRSDRDLASRSARQRPRPSMSHARFDLAPARYAGDNRSGFTLSGIQSILGGNAVVWAAGRTVPAPSGLAPL